MRKARPGAASPRRGRPRRWIVAAVAALAAFAGCGPSATSPGPRPVVARFVTVVLHDSLGAPIASADLWWAGHDASGRGVIATGRTDAAGAESRTLAAGPWSVMAPLGTLSAGARFIVPGSERLPSDSQLVVVTAHTPSSVSGLVTLAGRTDHRGTVVAGPAPFLTVTDSSGAWTIAGLPPGRWNFEASNLGFRSGVVQATVTIPGSAVVAPAVQLVSEP